MFTAESMYEIPKICYCLSTDTKDLAVPNGSILIEMDTSKRYFFDAENQDWIEWSPS